MDTPTISESRDGTGAGDHDVAFAWGSPRAQLTTMCQARLLVMRGYVMDFRQGEAGGAADGDLYYTAEPESIPAPVVVAPVAPAFDPLPDNYDG
jgi:hypothetical protein